MKLRERVRRRVVSGIMAFLCSVILIIAGKTNTASAEAQPLLGASVLSAAGAAISGQPQNVTVAVGDTATFTVTASGTSLTYQWQCKSPGSSSWSNSSQTGAKTKTLSVVTNVNHNGYQYRCVIKSGNTQTISNAATLTVIPKFIMQSANQRALVGETATFTVSAAGKGTLTYQWQCKSPTASSWSNSTQTGAKTASLSVTTNVNHEGYKYRCVVTDANGKKAYSNAASLAVAPKFTTQPKSTSVTVGETATFTVVAKGKATLTYQWQCKEPGATSWRDSALGTAKSAKLSIKTDTGYNGYQYRCIVTDGNNRKTTSNAVTLTINPKITTQPSNVNAKAGTTVTFTVVAKGKATLKYQWQYKAPNSSSWKNSSQSSATTSKLSFTATVNHQGYRYRCVVTDGNGKKVTSNEATISVFGIAKQPISYSVPKGILAQFSVTAIGTGLTYQWQVKESANSEWRNSAVSGNKSAKIAFNAYDINNGYQYRCIVTDGQGRTVTSNVAKLTIGELAIDEHNFPDPIFRGEISGFYETDEGGTWWHDGLGIDVDRSGTLSREEILAVKSISLHHPGRWCYYGYGIEDLTGIEYFSGLESLYIDGNELKKLDLRNNSLIKDLSCESCMLTELNIAMLPELVSLNCNDNQLKKLNVSKNTKLSELSCEKNQLSSLDVSALTALQYLYCRDNQIKSLNVEKNNILQKLDCSGNQLTTLTLNGHDTLRNLDCNNNQLSSLSLGGCTSLYSINCSNNQLSSLSLGDCTSLNSIYCTNNKLTSLNLSGLSNLNKLACQENQLTSLTLTGCTNLTELLCQSNCLESLPLSEIPNVIYLYCHNNCLKTLSVSNCSELVELACDGNGLTSLDVSGCTKMTALFCSNNELTGLSIGNNAELISLACRDNKLAKLDISKNTKLQMLSAERNPFNQVTVGMDNAIQYWETDAMGLLEQPESYQTPAGGTAVFSVMVGGTDLSYQWQVKTSSSGAWNNLSTDSAKTNVLKFSAQTSQNGYQYRCQISKNGTTITTNAVSLTVGNIAVNEVNFPDDNFRAFIADSVDKDKNGNLSKAEIAAVTEMDVHRLNIENLKGLEFFTNLQHLNCVGNYIMELDLSRTTALRELTCSETSVTLNLRNNTELKELNCNWCWQIVFLDLRNNTALEYLSCGVTSLQYLNLSNNKKLKELEFWWIPLRDSTLDLSNNPAVENVYIGGSNIDTVDLTNNTSLKGITVAPYVTLINMPEGAERYLDEN